MVIGLAGVGNMISVWVSEPGAGRLAASGAPRLQPDGIPRRQLSDAARGLVSPGSDSHANGRGGRIIPARRGLLSETDVTGYAELVIESQECRRCPMTLVPAGSAERTIGLDGGRIRVLCSTAPARGCDRTPLLLIHGGGTDNAAISWYGAFQAFGPDRRVVAVDLPGFGGTTGIEPVEALVLIGPGGLVPVLRNRAVQFAAWLGAQLPERVLPRVSRPATRFLRAALRGMVMDPAPPVTHGALVRCGRTKAP